jgi:hypothetical protein
MKRLDQTRKDLAEARSALAAFGDIYDIFKHRRLTFEEHTEKRNVLADRVAECTAEVERAFSCKESRKNFG